MCSQVCGWQMVRPWTQFLQSPCLLCDIKGCGRGRSGPIPSWWAPVPEHGLQAGGLERPGHFSASSRKLEGGRSRQILRRRAEQAWRMRWMSILGCSAAKAFASSLLNLQGRRRGRRDTLQSRSHGRFPHVGIGRNRLWPNRLWPKPTLAKVLVLVVCKDFGFWELIVWVFRN